MSISPVQKPHFLLVLGLSALLLAACDGNKPKAVTPPPPAVTVEAALSKEVTEWDEYTGRLQAVESVQIRARVAGYLNEVRFKEGALVKKDEVLFVIDPRPYQAEVERAESAVAQARAQLTQADGELKRAQGLIKSRSISQEQYETRINNAAAAAAGVRVAEAQAAQAKLSLEFTEVKSPVDGRVGRALISVGNLVSADSSLLTTVVSLDPIHAYFDADENAMLKYMEMARSGARPSARDTEVPLRLALANEQGFPHEGVIDFVDNAVDPVTGTLRARGRFSNASKYFTPGMFARVQVRGSLPYQAVLTQDLAIGFDQSQKYVLVVNSQSVAEYRAVTTGPLIDGLRVIRTGLKAGENVIVNGLQRVRPGVTVKAEPFKRETAVAGAAKP